MLSQKKEIQKEEITYSTVTAELFITPSWSALFYAPSAQQY